MDKPWIFSDEREKNPYYKFPHVHGFPSKQTLFGESVNI